jgi:hypothetical protein
MCPRRRIPITRHGTRQDPFSLLPTLHGAGDIQQIAGVVGQDVAMLAGDLIVANPAPANRSLKSDRRSVDGSQKRVEVRTVGNVHFREE